jgi:hypothetical protein
MSEDTEEDPLNHTDTQMGLPLCNREHVAILYNHDPCPLCHSHKRIQELETLLQHLSEEIGAEGDPRSPSVLSMLRKIEYALREMT